nr:hypothetical protein Iba_chr11eCG3300 [Ipomoea batatas]
MLNKLIQLDNGTPARLFLPEENLQLPQFIKSSHIQFVVFVRREFRSSKLRQHLSRILQCILQIGKYESAMHVEGVLLKARNPGGEPFLFVFYPAGDHRTTGLLLLHSYEFGFCTFSLLFWFLTWADLELPL